MENDLAIRIRRLEMLRRHVETLEYLIGDAYDFLDRGLPDEYEREETWLNIKAWQDQYEIERNRLEQHVSRLRSSEPELIENWVDIHQEIYRQVKERYEQSQGFQYPPQDVAIMLVEVGIEKWEKVRHGDHFYVYTNRYLMRQHEDLILAGFGF